VYAGIYIYTMLSADHSAVEQKGLHSVD